jgi:hypothetical protein
LSETTAAVSGSVQSLKAEYTLAVTAGNRVAGFKVASSPTSSSFVIQADKFQVVNGDGNNPIVPFTVTGNTVFIDSAKITTITAGNIAAGAITADKISTGAITTDKLGANVVTAAKIAAGTITATEISANAITATKIATDAVTADKIQANAITSAKIAAGAITADMITAGTMNAARISGGTISGVSLDIGTGTFTVSSIGALVASSANISGTITSTVGTIGGWTIGPSNLTSANVTLDSAGSSIRVTSGNNAAGMEIISGFPRLYVKNAAGTITGYMQGDSTANGGFFGLANSAGQDTFTVYGNTGQTTMGTAIIGSGGVSCTGGASFGGSVGINNSTIVLNSNGSVSAASYNSTSSRRYKQNIKDFTNGLAIIQKLRPVTFDWNQKDIKNDIGFIAEEVYEVLPNIVHKNDKGEVESLDYSKIVPILIATVQQLSKELAEIKSAINQVKK